MPDLKVREIAGVEIFLDKDGRFYGTVKGKYRSWGSIKDAESALTRSLGASVKAMRKTYRDTIEEVMVYGVRSRNGNPEWLDENGRKCPDGYYYVFDQSIIDDEAKIKAEREVLNERERAIFRRAVYLRKEHLLDAAGKATAEALVEGG